MVYDVEFCDPQEANEGVSSDALSGKVDLLPTDLPIMYGSNTV